MATTSEANALGYNLDVDYVVRYSFGDVGECLGSPTLVGTVLTPPMQISRKRLSSSRSSSARSRTRVSRAR